MLLGSKYQTITGNITLIISLSIVVALAHLDDTENALRAYGQAILLKPYNALYCICDSLSCV